MRYVLLGIALAACAAQVAAEPARVVRIDITPKHHVDLNSDGALEAIRRDDPGRYERISQAVEAAQVTSCETLPQVLKTRLDILDTSCSPFLLLTSFPPKSRVSFLIDDTEYSLNVVQYKLAPAKIFPAIEPGR
jgi:hypothetical protein